MRMAELARRSGLTVPTIKYYLREGLLPPGRRTDVNQAVYSELHLERFCFICVLVAIAGLPLSRVREVVRAVDGRASALEAMAVTQDALVRGEGGEEPPPDEEASLLLDQVIRDRGWRCQPGSPAYLAAVRAVAGLRAEGLSMLLERLDDYAGAADRVGRIDVCAVESAQSLDGMVRGVVLGSVLRRPLLDALVLLAQQHYASTSEGAVGE